MHRKKRNRKFDNILFEYFFKRSYTYLCACLFLFVLVFAFPALSQPAKDSLQTKYIDGRKFYIHKVSKGETLYGISKKYDVEIKDIVLENPLTINGLSLGLTIRIPAPVDLCT